MARFTGARLAAGRLRPGRGRRDATREGVAGTIGSRFAILSPLTCKRCMSSVRRYLHNVFRVLPGRVFPSIPNRSNIGQACASPQINRARHKVWQATAPSTQQRHVHAKRFRICYLASCSCFLAALRTLSGSVTKQLPSATLQPLTSTLPVITLWYETGLCLRFAKDVSGVSAAFSSLIRFPTKFGRRPRRAHKSGLNMPDALASAIWQVVRAHPRIRARCPTGLHCSCAVLHCSCAVLHCRCSVIHCIHSF